MSNYYYNIYLPHIEKAPTKVSAPKNFWPYSYQFYMCNPIQTFSCTVEDALDEPKININTHVGSYVDRSMIEFATMPPNLLKQAELSKISLDANARKLALRNGITEPKRSALNLQDTDIAKPPNSV